MALLPILLSLVSILAACLCDHILVTSTSSSYSHWSQILHISKGLLSNKKDHFITFIIDETNDEYLDTIRNERFDTASYQIIYTPSEVRMDGVIQKLSDSNVINGIFTLNTVLYQQSSTSIELFAVLLNHTQSNSTNNMRHADLQQIINQNLKHKQNDVASLIFHKKVDVCLIDYFHLFAISLCNSFDIPILLRVTPSVAGFAEYSTIMNTHLFFYNPFVFDPYPDLVNGTIMTYGARWKTFMKNICFKTFLQFMSYYTAIPMIHELNDRLSKLNINATIAANRYTNGWFSFWEKGALISNLGPPFSPAIYRRPRVKQYGFILFGSSTSPKLHDSELWKWVNSKEDTPILVISMGSKAQLTESAMHSIYTQLIVHSKANHYRVLWSLKQIIYEDLNKTNEELETEHFKIAKWIPQHELLQHRNVKLFFGHGGSGGVIESLYAKKLMILYPLFGDQFQNAQRLVELECGFIIKDKAHLSDLTQHIDTLLLDKSASVYYQSKLNHIHNMIADNGGLAEAVGFVEYAAKYGVKHLFCSYGANYDCMETVIPWYQQSMWDIYLIILLIISLFIIIVKELWRCLVGLHASDKSKKSKSE